MTKKNKNKTYLTFKVEGEFYALNVMQVTKIIDYQSFTIIPFTAEYMLGIIDLAGKVIPIVNAKKLLGCRDCSFNESHKIIIIDFEVDGEITYIGLLVDAVFDVTNMKDKEVQKSPTFGNSFKNDFITGVFNIGNSFIMLLEIKNLFTESELRLLLSQKEYELTAEKVS